MNLVVSHEEEDKSVIRVVLNDGKHLPSVSSSEPTLSLDEYLGVREPEVRRVPPQSHKVCSAAVRALGSVLAERLSIRELISFILIAHSLRMEELCCLLLELTSHLSKIRDLGPFYFRGHCLTPWRRTGPCHNPDRGDPCS